MEFAAYTANLEFDTYFVELDRVSLGCRAFVANNEVLSTDTNQFSETMVMDPIELLVLAGVPDFFSPTAMIPIHVECVGDEGIEKGHVTGMVIPPFNFQR